MILTGKCKEDFYAYITKGMSNFAHDMEIEFFNQKSNLEKNALIIEFFDSVKYSENTSLWEYCFSNAYWNRGLKEYKQSITEAIKKANEIYNSKR